MKSESDNPIDYSDVEARRSTRSGRRLSAGRRLYYALGRPVLQFVYWAVTATYRVQKVIGAEHVDRMLADTNTVYAPCYWHQHVVLVPIDGCADRLAIEKRLDMFSTDDRFDPIGCRDQSQNATQ